MLTKYLEFMSLCIIMLTKYLEFMSSCIFMLTKYLMFGIHVFLYYNAGKIFGIYVSLYYYADKIFGIHVFLYYYADKIFGIHVFLDSVLVGFLAGVFWHMKLHSQRQEMRGVMLLLLMKTGTKLQQHLCMLLYHTLVRYKLLQTENIFMICANSVDPHIMVCWLWLL